MLKVIIIHNRKLHRADVWLQLKKGVCDASDIAEALKASHPDVPWRDDSAGFRNVLMHQYPDVERP